MALRLFLVHSPILLSLSLFGSLWVWPPLFSSRVFLLIAKLPIERRQDDVASGPECYR